MTIKKTNFTTKIKNFTINFGPLFNKYLLNNFSFIMGLATIGGLVIRYIRLTGKVYSELDGIFLFILFFELLNLFLIVLSIILFFIIFWNNEITILMYQNFKKLSVPNKIFFIWFTFCLAIPNKILVNNNIPNFLTTLSIVLILVISGRFPIFFLLYVIFWIYVIQSYLFARLYEGKESFKTLLDTKLFENNQTFNKIYFSFFWGNMASKGANKTYVGVLGTFIGGLYNLERRNEGTLFRKLVREELLLHKKHTPYPLTPKESFELQKEIENHIRSRGDLDLPILTAEKVFTDAVKAIADYMGK